VAGPERGGGRHVSGKRRARARGRDDGARGGEEEGVRVKAEAGGRVFAFPERAQSLDLSRLRRVWEEN